MKKLDRYIVTSFIGPFVAILLIVIFILLLDFLWIYIDELVGKGLSLKVILEFLGWGCATMLPLSLPLATLLSSMMTMGNLAENSELIAMKSAGISLGRIMTPLIVSSFLVSVGAFFVANNLVPVAYNNIYSLREDIVKTKEEIKIPSKTFYDGIEGYILRVEENDRKTGMMTGVMVYNHTGGQNASSLTIADSALMKMSEDKSFINFKLFHGSNYEEEVENRRDTVRQLRRTDFTSQELIIPLENYGFHKSKTGKYSDQAKSMSLKDLTQDQDSIRTRLDSARALQLRLFRENRALPRWRQLDTAAQMRALPLYDLSKIPQMPLELEITMHTEAVNKANSFISDLLGYDRETAIPAFTLKLIDIEIYKKFALALACFILFFVGAPLGAIIRKGGLGTPAIISILFFVLYYIVDMVGTKLARDGAIDPVSGAFISSYILFPVGIFLTYKAINDESILATDSLKAFIKKIRIKIMETFHKASIVYMGTPEFAVAPLDALIKAGYKVSAVVTTPDKAFGRGMQVGQSAVKKYALEHSLPVLQPENLKDPQFLEELSSYKPDIIAVVAFRLLPREVWSLPRKGAFNLHAALLPQYRGAAPINWALINGERMTGVTSFLLDDGMDTGKILIREQCAIEESDNASSLHDKLMEMGSKVVVQTVEALLDGKYDSRLQESFIQGSETLHKAPKITKELCCIRWSESGRHVVNLIRGLSDYPAAFTTLSSQNGSSVSLKIFRAHKAEKLFADISSIVPGKVYSDGKTWMGIGAADSLVLLDEVQLSGKKRLAVEDFLRGFRNPEDYKA